MTVQGQAQAHQGTHDAKRQRTTHNANTGYNQVWVLDPHVNMLPQTARVC